MKSKPTIEVALGLGKKPMPGEDEADEMDEDDPADDDEQAAKVDAMKAFRDAKSDEDAVEALETFIGLCHYKAEGTDEGL